MTPEETDWNREMIVQITDDFDLNKIAESGQCFRVKSLENGMFRFITQHHVLYISKIADREYSVSCSKEEWSSVWTSYFDLDRCYQELRKTIPKTDPFLRKAAEEGAGIRLLSQDHWETLISFIISQRKSIPAIKNSVEAICAMFGTAISTPYEVVYSFPTAEELLSAGVSRDDLLKCKVGYRANYILDAISQVAHGSLSLDDLEMLADDALIQTLIGIYGVGKKVANCVCLFSYNRSASAPVDTWIQKVIDKYYGGIDPLCSYGDCAGIMQQYIFYYAQKHKKEFD
jgi:N-glycosylase/DNA lyase